jgi:hypothetical protein
LIGQTEIRSAFFPTIWISGKFGVELQFGEPGSAKEELAGACGLKHQRIGRSNRLQWLRKRGADVLLSRLYKEGLHPHESVQQGDAEYRKYLSELRLRCRPQHGHIEQSPLTRKIGMIVTAARRVLKGLIPHRDDYIPSYFLMYAAVILRRARNNPRHLPKNQEYDSDQYINHCTGSTEGTAAESGTGLSAPFLLWTAKRRIERTLHGAHLREIAMITWSCRFSVWKAACFLSGLLVAAAAAGQTPSREYIYFGGRVIAIDNAIQVAVSPSSVTVSSGSSLQFSATVSGTSNQAVDWSVVEGSTGGSITPAGLYTAPTVAGQTSFTIRAASQADPTKFGSATVTVNPPPAISVVVSPATATLTSGDTQQFTATVSGTSNQAVNWSVVEGSTGGSITSAGVYTAPTVGAQKSFTIRATSQADPTKFGSATVTVNPPCSVSINPSSATVFSGRRQILTAATSNCGGAAVTWMIVSGPGTLSANGNTATYTAPQGVVSTQTANVRASVTGRSATATASITIQPSQPPALYTMSPNNSSGTRQQFSFTVSDAQGHDDINGVQAVFLSDWAYACQVAFNAEWSLLSLRQDNGTWTDVALGSAQAPSNSYCTLYAATSTVARSGNQLTLTLDLQFKPIFSGQKRVEAAASDYAGNVVGYQEVGRWLVPGVAGTSQAAVMQFWTPSQVAPGQSFQVALVVRNTGQNIWQSNTMNGTQPHRLVSWNPQGNTTWGVSSLELPVQQVLPGQDVTILINATAPYSLGVKSFDWRMLHQGVEVFGQTASASITVTSTPYPESPHPYPNNANQAWSYYYNGSCGSLNVTFDPQTVLQAGDWLYITDANSYAVAGSPFSGSTLAGQTISVPGSSVFLQLVSNASGNGWGFRVTNVTCVPLPDPRFYDDFNSEVLFTSNWYHDTQFSQPLQGTISYSDAAWASVQLTFYGTGIRYYYTKAFNRGIAYVYIDGQYQGSVDQYSSGIEWQSSTLFSNLPRGYHTITVYVSGAKQAASQWHWVDVDGFQTYP